MAYTDFDGFLIATPANAVDIDTDINIGTINNVAMLKFPHKYIKEGSYSINPDQREELKVRRDDYTRDLYRITALGEKTAIDFTTRDNLHLKQIDEIQNFFLNHEVNAKERKIQLYFWNTATMTYDSGYFYRPNMDFPIKKIGKTDMTFGELKLEFVEY